MLLHKLAPTPRLYVIRGLVLVGCALVGLAGFFIPWFLLRGVS